MIEQPEALLQDDRAHGVALTLQHAAIADQQQQVSSDSWNWTSVQMLMTPDSRCSLIARRGWRTTILRVMRDCGYPFHSPNLARLAEMLGLMMKWSRAGADGHRLLDEAAVDEATGL